MKTLTATTFADAANAIFTPAKVNDALHSTSSVSTSNYEAPALMSNNPTFNGERLEITVEHGLEWIAYQAKHVEYHRAYVSSGVDGDVSSLEYYGDTDNEAVETLKRRVKDRVEGDTPSRFRLIRVDHDPAYVR